MFLHAITRQPGPDYAQGLTTSDLPEPDLGAALLQHGHYVACLENLGLKVTTLPPAPGFPDACFVEDTAVVTAEVAVITRPGALSRREEILSIEPILAQFRPELRRIVAPGTVDGGDILQVGRQFFIGISDRTNAEGARQLAEILTGHGYRCTTIPVAAGLHLKSSLNYIGHDLLLVTAAFQDHPAIKEYQKILCPPGEEYAANTLLVNGTLVTPRGFPGTLRLLRTTGFPIIELDTSEYRKMDGGLTCLSLRLEAAQP